VRVLHVIPSFHPATAYGGPIASSLGLCRALAVQGADVRVLTTDADGDRNLNVTTGAELRVESLSVIYCKRWAGDSFAPAIIAHLCREVKLCDIVHLTAVYSFPTIPTLLFARMFRKPIFWSARGALQNWQGTTKKIAKYWWRKLAFAVAPQSLVIHATSAEEAVSIKSIVPPDVVVLTVGNGVEIPSVAARDYDASELHLLYVGRIHPIKGIETLLRALALANRPGVRVTIAGAGDVTYVGNLVSLAEALGISDAVQWVGYADDSVKERLYAVADALVLPSHSENFGMAAAEALAHGVAVIASHGTPWTILEKLKMGRWVPTTPEGFAEVFANCTRDELRDMGSRGRVWAHDNLSWTEVARVILSEYGRLVDQRESP
jgi:glycosyltransferase involved in cell wall biosynthesis